MKICANLSLLFTELPLLERVGAAAAAGFDGVEIQFPYEVPAGEMRDALQRFHGSPRFSLSRIVVQPLCRSDWIDTGSVLRRHPAPACTGASRSSNSRL